jgi:hypothetical protein
MDRRARLTKELKEAERELEAASRLCDVRAAAKKLNPRGRSSMRWTGLRSSNAERGNRHYDHRYASPKRTRGHSGGGNGW